jgi:hypothetical protein
VNRAYGYWHPITAQMSLPFRNGLTFPIFQLERMTREDHWYLVVKEVERPASDIFKGSELQFFERLSKITEQSI